MRVQILPSSFSGDADASQQQRLTTFVVNDAVAFDAGSLAFGCDDRQRSSVRDIVISHTHLDHIAGLPIFIDDLFATVEGPIRVHAAREMIDVLEEHVFNWKVYPRFSELSNKNGKVLEYVEYEFGRTFKIGTLLTTAIEVDHLPPSAGFIVSDSETAIGISGDTSQTDEFWTALSAIDGPAAIFVECAFPDEFSELAKVSHHLTPRSLAAELSKFDARHSTVYVSNIKAMYRQTVIEELMALGIKNLKIAEIGKVYEF